MGLPPAGEGGQTPEGGGEWSAHLPHEGGVIDVPPEDEFAHLDGQAMDKPDDSAPESDWVLYERWCCWFFVHKRELRPRDCNFCGRRNVYFGGSTCVGIGCLKKRTPEAQERASRPPGQAAKRRRTGDQSKRERWMGTIHANKRTIDAMALGPEERDKAKRTADDWDALQARRQRQRREEAAEDPEENDSWGKWGPKDLPQRPAPKTPPRKKAPKPPTKPADASAKAPAKASASRTPRPRAKPSTTLKPEAEPQPPPPQQPPPPPPPPKAEPRPGAAHSQAAGSERTEEEKWGLIHERRAAMLKLVFDNKKKRDEAQQLQNQVDALYAQNVAAQASRGAWRRNHQR